MIILLAQPSGFAPARWKYLFFDIILSIRASINTTISSIIITFVLIELCDTFNPRATFSISEATINIKVEKSQVMKVAKGQQYKNLSQSSRKGITHIATIMASRASAGMAIKGLGMVGFA